MKLLLATVAVCVALLCSTDMANSKLTNCRDGTLLYDADLLAVKDKYQKESEEGFLTTMDTPLHRPDGIPEKMCNAQGVLKITFPPATNGVQTRRLKFVFQVDPRSITDYSFHIGDARDNIGMGGSQLTSHSAEVFNLNTNWVVRTNEEPGHEQLAIDDQFLYDIQEGVVTDEMEVVIGDEYIRIANDALEFSKEDRSEYLFALRGQSPAFGKPDGDISVALNRRILQEGSTDIPSTAGLCNVRIIAQTCEWSD